MRAALHSLCLFFITFTFCVCGICLFVGFVSFCFCFLFCFYIIMKNTETKINMFGFPLPSTLLRMAICSHNRQRQKRVGMKTPKATRMGNMRLLLSEA